MRSLHEFINRANHKYAVRVYSGKLKVDTAETINGKKFFLLNLPFYLTGDIRKYLHWFIEEGIK
ncbi:MAG: hypothetical protein M1308_21660 [Actinobacteria bacterium]|nr:hypothetical protein [Actinomycetota bacterium]